MIMGNFDETIKAMTAPKQEPTAEEIEEKKKETEFLIETLKNMGENK